LKSALFTGVKIFTGKEIIKKGFILIENGVIKKVGVGRADWHVGKQVDNFQSFENKNFMFIPGFVNAHAHSGMAFLRGAGGDRTFEEWLFKEITPREAKLDAEAVYISAILSQMEMARNGITAFCDMYFHSDQICKAVSEFGMRASITRGLLDKGGENGRLEENLKLFDHWNNAGNGLIKVGFGPHSPYMCSREYLKLIAKTALELNSFVNIHIRESEKEKEMYSIEELADTGIFNVRCLVAHGVYIKEKEMDILNKDTVHIIHNPSSNLILANGIAPIPQFRRKGINTALGTDSVASNNTLDIWREMLLSALIHKGNLKDPTVISASDAFEMATLGGAQALGFEDTGLIGEGYKADLALINLDSSHYFPENDLISNLVYSGRSSDVIGTMVEGEWIYYFGKYPKIDERKVIKKAKEKFQQLFC